MLFGFSPTTEVLLISIGLGILLAALYRALVDQKKVSALKTDLDRLKKESSEAQKAGNKAEAERLTKELMRASSGQAKMSMKPMMASLVIFGITLWFLATVYGPVLEFPTTATGTGLGSVKEGVFQYQGENLSFVYYESSGPKVKMDLNGNGFEDDAEKPFNEVLFERGPLMWKATATAEKEGQTIVSFAPDIVTLPFALPFLGGTISWFWWYILVSIPVNIVFRKLLGVV